jgi:uncharacterized lipoprotein YajG
MKILAILAIAAALAGCATTGDRKANTANWYAKQCGPMMDELGICRY